MELVTELVNNQFALYIPVALILVGGILLFAFGFKSAEQPPFDKLSSNIGDDRKSVGKKRKLKEKKPVINGNVVGVGEKTDKSPSKDTKRATKEPSEPRKKADNTKNSERKNKETPAIKTKKSENLEEIKNKKNAKSKSHNEKPVDFDDGSWETVPTKSDKKKKQESPAKKEKKVKKVERSLEIEKLAKEVVNKEIQEKEKIKVEPIVQEDEPVEIEIVPVEPKKEKKPEKKVKKDVAKLDVKPVKVEIETDDAVKEESSPKNKDNVPQGGVAFDELGDVWTETKIAKKSKKKTRRDN